MTSGEIASKCLRKAHNYLSPSMNIRRLAFALDKLSLRGNPGIYVERQEYGPSNLEIKLERQTLGGPFEPRDVTLTNCAAVEIAKGLHPTSVLEIGCGTAMFASSLAKQIPACQIIASEFEDATRKWSEQNRAVSNITFCKKRLDEFSTDQFDLAVALEVIEHIADYASFLQAISLVAPTVVLSTPNKHRSAFESIANPPEFDQHVREWSAGEFYWVLRVFWDDVKIYTLPAMSKQIKKLEADENYAPTYEETGVNCRDHSMIAVCTSPVRP